MRSTLVLFIAIAISTCSRTENDSSAKRNRRNQPIHLLKENLGLITEKIAPLATSSTDWKIIHKTDLRPYYQAKEILVNAALNVIQACGLRCQYSNLIDEAVSVTRQAERVLDLLIVDAADGEHHRARRSLFPFLGSIHKLLYGTLDENDKAENQATMKIVAEDTRQTAGLLANQTSIVEHKLSDLDVSVNELEANLKNFKQEFLETSSRIAALVAENQLKIVLTKFSLDMEVLTDAILFAAKGMVHPRIVPPNTFRDAARTVANSVSNVKFPLLEEGFAEGSAIPIMKISKLTVFISREFLIYQIVIPLLDIQRFNLFKASPLPAIQKHFNISNLAAYIWPEYNYFAVSESNRTYMPLLPEEVAGLRRLGDLLID